MSPPPTIWIFSPAGSARWPPTTNGEQVILGRGWLADAIRASATIPLLFKPFVLDGRQLVDGGIVDRLPTDVATKLGATS